MLDMTFVRIANIPARERKALEYSNSIKKINIFDIINPLILGAAISLFLLLIYYI